MKRPFALILDVDGTLAETERHGHRVAFNQAFAEAGLDWFWDEETYGRLLEIPGGRERIEAFIEERGADPGPGQTPAEFARRLHRSKTRHYLDLLRANQIELRPGVARLLVEAREEGVRLALCTTGSQESIFPLLRATLGPRGEDFFSAIVVQDGSLPSKPAPDLYLRTLEQLELEAGDCIAIEDSAIGVRAAAAAGIPVIACYNDYSRDQDFAPALAEVDGFGTAESPMWTRRGKPPDHGVIDVAVLRTWWRKSRRRPDPGDRPPPVRADAARD